MTPSPIIQIHPAIVIFIECVDKLCNLGDTIAAGLHGVGEASGAREIRYWQNSGSWIQSRRASFSVKGLCLACADSIWN